MVGNHAVQLQTNWKLESLLKFPDVAESNGYVYDTVIQIYKRFTSFTGNHAKKMPPLTVILM